MLNKDTHERFNLIYARYSTDDTDSFSIDSQVKRGIDYMARHNIRMDESYTFADEYTGTEFSRPEFDKVKRLLEQKRVDNIIVFKVNRISRKDHHALLFLEDYVWKHGAKLHIVEWGRTVENSKTDRMQYGIEAMFGTFEWRDIKDRTARGRREKAEQGIYLGMGFTPYGYAKIGTKRNTKLLVVEEEAEIIRMIFHLYVEKRATVPSIYNLLNAKGIPSPSARNPQQRTANWNESTIHRLLRDPRVIGEWYAFKLVTDEATGKQRRREKEQWIKQSFPHLAIVDVDLFQQAQEMLDSRRDKHGFAPKYQYLLARRSTCMCGGAAGVQKTQRKPTHKPHLYYRCGVKRPRKPDHVCSMPFVSATLTDNLVWEKVEALIRNPEWELERLQEAQQVQIDKHQEAIEERDSIEKIRADYERELDELYQDYKDKLITKDIYVRRKKPLDERLAAAEEVAREIQGVVDANVLSSGEIQHIVKTCNDISSVLDDIGVLEFEHKRKVIELLNVTGRFATEGEWIVYHIQVHSLSFDTVYIKDYMGGGTNSGDSYSKPGPARGTPKPKEGFTQKARSMNEAGYVTLPMARDSVTTRSSSGWRSTSSLGPNSGSSSRNSTPRCASEIIPGRTRPAPPPTRPGSEVVWCGEQNGRWRMSGVSLGSCPATL